MNKGMITKTATALILVALVMPPFIFGGWLMRILACLVAVLGAYEICELPEGKPDPADTVLLSVFVAYLTLAKEKYLPGGIGLFVFVVFADVLFRKDMPVEKAAFMFLVGMILCLGCRSVIRIYDEGSGFFAMMYVALACYICDTGAYFFGVFFGKHKMIPRISPNKTWEGAVGGYLSGLVVSLLFGLFFLKGYPKLMVIVSSAVLPAAAEVGDLAFSSIKRRFGIKDFGSFLPGHGGVLDRIDSLLFCLMLFQTLSVWWGI